MTPNEAIAYLKDPIGKREQHDEAVSMAIEALRNSPTQMSGTSDMISRQAVIDLWECYHPYIAVKANEFDRELRRLPSAQPEIIHCRDCIHYNAGFECLKEGYGIEYDEDYFCGDAVRRKDG